MLTCLIASQIAFTALPMTWIDGSQSMGIIVRPCVTEAHKPRDVERESLKARIEIMKRKGLG